MAMAVLPPPVDIDNDTKKAIIDGLKLVMAVFQESGCLAHDVTYQDLISDPEILMSFIQTFLEHRDQVDHIIHSRSGDGPVRDDDMPLICGVSLNQIQQLLVRTCAKKVFEQDRPLETVTATRTKKSFLFFKSTEHVEVQRPSNDPVEERKIRELSRYIAFGWQLPLIEAYRHYLTYQQIMEIGDDIVALQSVEDIAAVASYEPAVLKKVKQQTGADFGEILAKQPVAIGGIAVWNREMYEFYRKVLGEKAWTFFSREKAFFNIVAALDKTTARIIGDILCYVAGENLSELQRLNIDKVEVLVTSLKSAFGERLPGILSTPAFAKDILRKVVDNLIHTNGEKDRLMTAFMLSCKAQVPAVLEWQAKQPKA